MDRFLSAHSRLRHGTEMPSLLSTAAIHRVCVSLDTAKRFEASRT
jgi:hypothetical protein